MNQDEITRMLPGGKANVTRSTIFAAGLAALAACSKPLPAEGTREADLYRARGGASCHAAVSPASMPYATWQMVLPRMEERLRASGAPLTADEGSAIESYLKKYAR